MLPLSQNMSGSNTETQLIQSKGIYHGLPVYSSDSSTQTAIVTGANGISGYYMTKVLAEAPQRWSKIYCLSRRPPAIEGGLPKNAEFIQCDFLQPPEEIGETLKSRGIKSVDHVFFFAYIQAAPKPEDGRWSDFDEMIRLNNTLLSHFLSALTYLSLSPKRIVLQTGAKNYAIHNGLAKQPMEESDPRPSTEPNFYFVQEDTLAAWCARQPLTRYAIAMPAVILGAVPDAENNGALPLAIYCSVCHYLGEPLVFPAGFESWTALVMQSTGKLNAYMEEWLALGLPDSETGRETGVGTGGGVTGVNRRPFARSEGQGKFNSVDQTLFTWEDTWPRLAEWFALSYLGPDTSSSSAQYNTTIPISNAPRGYGPPGEVRMQFSFIDWAKSDKVRKAWSELTERYGLIGKGLQEPERVFVSLDFWLCLPCQLTFGTSKARKCGWHGVVDSNESLYEVFKEFVAIKMIPPLPQGRTVFS